MVHQKHRHNVRSQATAKRQEPEIVFKTLAPTFDGPIGGFMTEGMPALGSPARPTEPPERRPPRKPTKEASPPKPAPEPTTAAKPVTKAMPKATDSIPSTLAKSVSNSSSSSSLPSATGLDKLRETSSPSPTVGASSLAPSSSSNESGRGMSGGAKAGLAIGILLIVALLAGVALFFIHKKKKRDQALAQVDNEKSYNEKPFVAANAAAAPRPIDEDPLPLTRTMTTPTPPQLNIRPVTEFSPDFAPPALTAPAGNAFGATLTAGAVPARNLTGEKPSPPPKTPPNDPFTDPVNPFDSPTPVSVPATPLTPAAPRRADAGTLSPAISGARTPSPEMGIAATGIATAAGTVGVVAVRRTLTSDKSQGSPKNTASPAGDGLPTNSAMGMGSTPAGVAGAGPGAAPTGAPNVYRVQLDFAPSMEDELELKAGQLVRLIHEYDDGWALCVRLDRSSQGVVPRTCLSSRPVRPRPRNGSNAHSGPRGPPPPGMVGPPDDRSMSISSQVSYSPHPSPVPIPNPNPYHNHTFNQNGAPSPRFQAPQQGRPASPAGSYRTFPPQQQPGHPLSPVQFPQVPRSLSPGPGGRIPQPRSMSPGPGAYRPGPAAQIPQQRSISPGPRGQIPQPRSMSPGPGSYGPGHGPVSRIPQPRSMSPGPYGPGGMQKPPTSAAGARRRSYSTSAAMAANNNSNASNGPQTQALPLVGSPLQQEHHPGQQPQPQVQAETPKPPKTPPITTGPIERKPVPSQSQPPPAAAAAPQQS
ncbi:uncharacterized protein PADG_00883 [Paracoccidioides brasiliensis Pb18]|uniref:SH3 domain-containing protein n=1 Tax=Paracoccidioides brasiliensis (strain Pb18) TaxID=502780 RepID=C1FYK7_PARBD|nr:uncharacterized protein PADG_00883 [Paracoccidioides brasiliensis Pb18]EEH44594.1 hypothetical protein PADG_00883 [Paracoccidioides brasiliensis Pb18]